MGKKSKRRTGGANKKRSGKKTTAAAAAPTVSAIAETTPKDLATNNKENATANTAKDLITTKTTTTIESTTNIETKQECKKEEAVDKIVTAAVVSEEAPQPNVESMIVEDTVQGADLDLLVDALIHNEEEEEAVLKEPTKQEQSDFGVSPVKIQTNDQVTNEMKNETLVVDEEEAVTQETNEPTKQDHSPDKNLEVLVTAHENGDSLGTNETLVNEDVAASTEESSPAPVLVTASNNVNTPTDPSPTSVLETAPPTTPSPSKHNIKSLWETNIRTTLEEEPAVLDVTPAKVMTTQVSLDTPDPKDVGSQQECSCTIM